MDNPASPVRMRLSRKAGFNLQAESRALNGLEAVKITRPGPWGNPFTVTEALTPGAKIRASFSAGYLAVPTVQDAVDCHAEMMAAIAAALPGTRGAWLRDNLPNLRGKNVACWCRLDAPCHGDNLLRLANAPIRCDALPLSQEDADVG